VRDGAMRGAVVALLTVGMALIAGPACSSSRDLESAANTGTTIRRLADDIEDDEALAGGSEGAQEMQKIIDQLLASNDPCAILTQKDVKGYEIDATTLASSAARRVLTNGVIDVYDHLIVIVPDDAIKPALQAQRDTFVQVLEVVDRYAANPTAKQGNDQINTLMTGEDFVRAQSAVAGWTSANCS
jgi:hypothetical protein